MTNTRPTDIEIGYINQGYELPEAWSWDMVHTERARYDVGEIYVPLRTDHAPCVAWGVPIINGAFLKHA